MGLCSERLEFVWGIPVGGSLKTGVPRAAGGDGWLGCDDCQEPRQGPEGAAEGRTRHGASAASPGAGPSSAEGDPRSRPWSQKSAHTKVWRLLGAREGARCEPPERPGAEPRRGRRPEKGRARRTTQLRRRDRPCSPRWARAPEASTVPTLRFRQPGPARAEAGRLGTHQRLVVSSSDILPTPATSPHPHPPSPHKRPTPPPSPPTHAPAAPVTHSPGWPTHHRPPPAAPARGYARTPRLGHPTQQEPAPPPAHRARPVRRTGRLSPQCRALRATGPADRARPVAADRSPRWPPR